VNGFPFSTGTSSLRLVRSWAVDHAEVDGCRTTDDIIGRSQVNKCDEDGKEKSLALPRRAQGRGGHAPTRDPNPDAPAGHLIESS
jgi:hypothetical protein